MVFLKGLLLGLTLQISVGPVFFAVLHKSISNGFKEALKMTLAVAIVDTFYICVSFSMVSQLLRIPFLNRIISIMGMIILVYFGLTYIKNANKKENISITKNKDSSFIYGLKLTFINPLTIIFWSGTFGSLIAGDKLSGIFNIIIFSSGCVLATLLFLVVTSFFGNSLKKFINIKALKIVDYLVGIVLICFGMYMFIK